MFDAIIGLGIIVCLFTGFGFWVYMGYKFIVFIVRNIGRDW